MVSWWCVDVLSSVVFNFCRCFRERIVVARCGGGVVDRVENEPQIHLLLCHSKVVIVGVIGNDLILQSPHRILNE